MERMLSRLYRTLQHTLQSRRQAEHQQSTTDDRSSMAELVRILRTQDDLREDDDKRGDHANKDQQQH
jgi:hypothetical protein